MADHPYCTGGMDKMKSFDILQMTEVVRRMYKNTEAPVLKEPLVTDTMCINHMPWSDRTAIQRQQKCVEWNMKVMSWKMLSIWEQEPSQLYKCILCEYMKDQKNENMLTFQSKLIYTRP